jgi:Fe-S-cluster containining protein
MPILWVQSAQEDETASCEARQGKIETTTALSERSPIPIREGLNMDSPIRGEFIRLRLRQEALHSLTQEAEVQYPDYLRWICIRCTKSCRDLPGRTRSILLTQGDIERIKGVTKLSAREFSVSSRGSFPYVRKMRKPGGKCIFLRDSRCSIYGARPLICRFYPFSLLPIANNMYVIGFDSSCSGMGMGPRRRKRFFLGLVGVANKELRSQQHPMSSATR